MRTELTTQEPSQSGNFSNTYIVRQEEMKKEKKMKKLLLLVLALMLSACTTIARAGEPKSEVEQARDIWQAANISHYRINLFVSCFCAFNDEMPLIVEVKDGEVVSLESATGKELNPTNLQYYERYLTIDKLFAEIEKGFKTEGSEEAQQIRLRSSMTRPMVSPQRSILIS